MGYVLALNGNKSKLAEAVEALFTQADGAEYTDWPMDYYESNGRGHGRIETRRCWTLTAVDKIPKAGEWKYLNRVGMME